MYCKKFAEVETTGFLWILRFSLSLVHCLQYTRRTLFRHLIQRYHYHLKSAAKFFSHSGGRHRRFFVKSKIQTDSRTENTSAYTYIIIYLQFRSIISLSSCFLCSASLINPEPQVAVISDRNCYCIWTNAISIH